VEQLVQALTQLPQLLLLALASEPTGATAPLEQWRCACWWALAPFTLVLDDEEEDDELLLLLLLAALLLLPRLRKLFLIAAITDGFLLLLSDVERGLNEDVVEVWMRSHHGVVVERNRTDRT